MILTDPKLVVVLVRSLTINSGDDVTKAMESRHKRS